jgi:hypothetical protein
VECGDGGGDQLDDYSRDCPTNFGHVASHSVPLGLTGGGKFFVYMRNGKSSLNNDQLHLVLLPVQCPHVTRLFYQDSCPLSL